MGLLLRNILCAISGAAFFLPANAIPTHLKTTNPLEGHVLREKSRILTSTEPKIVWSTTEKTRHETGGSEGCFGISTGSGGAELFALSPNVVAITFPEYGCKGQPNVAVCGNGVAERLQQTAIGVNDLDGDEDVNTLDPVTIGPPPSTSSAADSQTPVQTTGYDSPQKAFRGTALERPALKTLGCSAETSSMQYTAERPTRFSDPGRFALEEYSTFMSLRLPEPAVAKSVFLARVDSLGTIHSVQSGCAPSKSPATEIAAAVPCPETPTASMNTGTAPASGITSPPAQTLTLECPRETANKAAGVPASPPMYNAPALLPAARLPVMTTPAPVVYIVDP